MSAAEVDLSGRVIDGRYRVVDQLGRGGMGSVFRVQHVHSHEWFALKVLHPNVAADRMMVERFVREARAAASLRSKHVVKIVDAQRDHVGPDGAAMPYLVMELLEGSNLEAIIQRRGALPKEEVAWLMKQVGKALDLAHERGIVHRDLKPENLFIALDEDSEPVAKVCDFGIAKLVGESAAGLLATGSLETMPSSLGTPMYMSPEQLRDASAVDARTDQWALALIAFKALSGREYFGDAKSSGNLMVRILVDPIAAPSTKGLALGDDLDTWFMRSCARDPSGRWPSVGAQVASLIAALEVTAPVPVLFPGDVAAIESAETGAGPPAVTPVDERATGAPYATTNGKPTENASQRRRFGIALVAVLAVIGGGVALARMNARPSAPPPASAAATPIAPTPTPIATPTPTPIATPIATPTPTPTPTPTAKPTPAAAKPTTKPSAAPSPAPPAAVKAKLPAGAPCSRGGECASGYCFAEQCQ